MNTVATYDVAIAGGGLAGLALAIQLRQQGHSVILIEKDEYPLHKVCGEYISLESWDFLKQLGVDLDAMNVPIITQLEISSPAGKLLKQRLPLGGFGISRYLLDESLANIAKKAGVVVLENTKLNDIVFEDEAFTLTTNTQKYKAAVACACYGKRSNLDIKWKRPFSTAAKNKRNNYIGVKYHVRSSFLKDTIALYGFKNGYCGMVKIEEDLYNLCYLSSADNLKAAGNDIKEMERTVLSQNPRLKNLFEEIDIVSAAPLTISQISFDKKSQIENHVIMIGDAAGMITPLCGNGMSMALHASKIASSPIHDFLKADISREQLEQQYSLQWKQQFAGRLRTGRVIQGLFGKLWLFNVSVSVLKIFSPALRWLVKQTHGKPF